MIDWVRQLNDCASKTQGWAANRQDKAKKYMPNTEAVNMILKIKSLTATRSSSLSGGKATATKKILDIYRYVYVLRKHMRTQHTPYSCVFVIGGISNQHHDATEW